MDTGQQKNNPHNTVAVWAITPNGRLLADRIQQSIENVMVFVSEKIAGQGGPPENKIVFHRLTEELTDRFDQYPCHVFLFSTGIAVRMLAPLLKSKTCDPAVVVLDDQGRHAVSLLSGHLGGANALAEKIGAVVGARPVITTATDVNRLPAIDMIAKKNGLFIETPENIKRINMAFLTKKKIKVHDPYGFITPFVPAEFIAKDNEPAPAEHIFCDFKTGPVSRETFIVRPPCLSIGVGCNRGTAFEVIKNFITQAFDRAGFSLNSIKRMGTTDVKKDEPGLLALSRELGIDLDFYTKEELNSVRGIQTPSKMVEKHLGVRSVCEASALLSARKLPCALDSGGEPELILPKQKNKDVTVAVAILP